MSDYKIIHRDTKISSKNVNSTLYSPITRILLTYFTGRNNMKKSFLMLVVLFIAPKSSRNL